MAKTLKSIDTTQKKGPSKKTLGVAPKVKTVKRQHKSSKSAKPPKAKLSSKPKAPPKAKIVANKKPVSKVDPQPAIEASSNILASEPQVALTKRKRTKINLETYIEKIHQAVHKCDVEIEKLSSNPSGERKGIKTLKSVRRTLLDLEMKAPKLTKLRRRYKMSGSIRKNSGLTTPQNISPELRTFLKIEKGRNLSRIEVTRAINSYINIKKDENRPNILEWAYLNPDHRNLQNEKDKRIIFPDVPLAKLLRYSQYKKDVASAKITESHKNKLTGLKETKIVTSDVLHYRTVQKLIQVHYL